MQSIPSIAVSLCCLWALLALPTGCGGGHKTYYEPSYTERFYTPQKIQIRPGLIQKPEFEICEQVTVLNVQTSQEQVPIGAYTHKWYANLHRWTDTAVGVTRHELKDRDVTVMSRAPKVLKLAVTKAELFWEFRRVGCRLVLQVITGDGYVIDFATTSKSTDLYDACDSAMTKAVAKMFDHDAVRDYLTCPESPKDSDCDGVPDDEDLCPGTPQGVPVDKDGCPLDTDSDGVPDSEDDCPGTPAGVKVDKRGCPLDTDGDGVPDFRDDCPDTPADVKVDKQGCPLDTDGDGVPDFRDDCPDTPAGAEVDAYGCWSIGIPLFDFDRFEIKPEYHHLLDRVARVLKENPQLQIEVQGHTDNVGTRKYNQVLSNKRAQAVVDYLAGQGVDRSRMSAKGYGFSRPRASSSTEAGRAENRRVEFQPIR